MIQTAKLITKRVFSSTIFYFISHFYHLQIKRQAHKCLTHLLGQARSPALNKAFRLSCGVLQLLRGSLQSAVWRQLHSD